MNTFYSLKKSIKITNEFIMERIYISSGTYRRRFRQLIMIVLLLTPANLSSQLILFNCHHFSVDMFTYSAYKDQSFI